MPARRVVFLGPPGTGKGTQAQSLARTRGLAAISSGDVLRAEIRGGSEIGRQADGFVRSGNLVPDEIVTGVMLTGLKRLPPDAGFTLDGFPRTVPQAEALAAGLAAMGARLDLVVDFVLADDVIVRRIVGRRVCTKCNASYNTEFLPPRTDRVCDNCGTALVQRVDDRADVIATRLQAYRVQTAPLVAYYERLGLLRAVDASRPADEVQRRVESLVDAVNG
ncbi:MAG: adenylate kinase [Planctomycetia bacterium]|nr:MAG: adenylate kinase [Planctomycetia bacterium]